MLADARVVREPLDIVVDLHGELARRREDEDARARREGAHAPRVELGLTVVGEHPLEQRQDERGRLAGAGLGAGDQVAALADDGQHGRLDRRRLGEPAVAHASQQPGVEAERVEGERFGRHVDGRGQRVRTCRRCVLRDGVRTG